MKLYIIIFLLCTIFSLSAQQIEIEELDFYTPDAAIEYFIERIKNNDFYGALEASAVNRCSEEFDYMEFTRYLQAMILHHSPAPSAGEMLKEINKIYFIHEISNNLKSFLYALLSTEKIISEAIPSPSDERVQEFINSLDISRLSGLEILETALPHPQIFNSEEHQKNLNRQAAIYGADEITERIVLYKFEDKYYMSGFECLRYGDSWLISKLNSNLAALPVGEIIVETDLNEFRSYTSD